MDPLLVGSARGIEILNDRAMGPRRVKSGVADRVVSNPIDF